VSLVNFSVITAGGPTRASLRGRAYAGGRAGLRGRAYAGGGRRTGRSPRVYNQSLTVQSIPPAQMLKTLFPVGGRKAVWDVKTQIELCRNMQSQLFSALCK
jgi:hypothetical protein